MDTHRHVCPFSYVMSRSSVVDCLRVRRNSLSSAVAAKESSVHVYVESPLPAGFKRVN